MPEMNPPMQMNWADAVDSDEVQMPEQQVTMKGDVKTIVTYHMNGNNEMVKKTQKFKTQKVSMPREVARRRTLKKFGLSENDAPGPQKSTTIFGEEVSLEFIVKMDSGRKTEDGDLWANSPIIRDINTAIRGLRLGLKSIDEDKPVRPINETGAYVPPSMGGFAAAVSAGSGGNSYKPPHLREGNAPSGGGSYVPPSRREGMTGNIRYGDNEQKFELRVTNLSQDTVEDDLRELCKNFGRLNRVKVPLDRTTQKCRGFGFVAFIMKSDAEKCKEKLNGFPYDHLILSVDWSSK